MHYLANYYKNLSEQLQEKVNFLETQLNEYQVRSGEKDGKKGMFYGTKFVPNQERPTNTISLSPSPTTIPNRRIFSPDSPERNPKNPFGPPIGREGEEGYWEPDNLLVGPNYKPRDRWIPGKRKPAIDKSTGKPIELFKPLLDKNPKPARPGIPMFPERKPLIGKVPMLGDTDAINVMPEPNRDEINIMPAPDRSMSQSEVDDEGNPTGLVRVTPKKPKVKRFGDSGPKIRPAPIKPQGPQNQNTAKNIDYANFEPELRQNERISPDAAKSIGDIIRQGKIKLPKDEPIR